jgi:tetratricopeptide (TPR) repeat protein
MLNAEYRMLNRIAPALVVCLSAFSIQHSALVSGAAAQDTIILAPRAEGAGRIVMTGRVVDYTGATITYETNRGEKQSLPGKQVLEIKSTWIAPHLAGDAAWTRRDFTTAATEYQAAMAAEPRRWARRLIASRLVAALAESDRWETAAEQFLSLVREDPATPYFAAIPLPWTTPTVAPTLEAKARAWSDDRTSSVAAVLGSSFLLSTSFRSDGLRRLNELKLDDDARVAKLAEAQLWRATSVTAEPGAIAEWESVVEKLPADLRAGPTFVVGKAWSSRNESERAALMLLRLPILYADRQPRLAAEGLWSGGQQLERLARPQQAATLYHELVRDYPETTAAATAKTRLVELSPPTP